MRTIRMPFKIEMVCAVLGLPDPAGRARPLKRVTRRPINTRNSESGSCPTNWCDLEHPIAADPNSPFGAHWKCKLTPEAARFYGDDSTVHRVRPRMQPGDAMILCEPLVKRFIAGNVACYESDGSMVLCNDETVDWRWRHDRLSGMYMPRSMVRYVLPIESVLPSVVGDVTDAEAWMEGFESREEFLALWSTIHPGGRDDTPLWRYQFGDPVLVKTGFHKYTGLAIDPLLRDEQEAD
jgi:hypothetical protein